MTLPHFEPGTDPGPDFVSLLHQVKQPWAPDATEFAVPPAELRHGTTCVALRYADGVVLAGDRRATAGNLISNHRMEKVFPADEYSGVAIAGVAGPAIEMVRLFQLQLEHYEKVEGTHISLEGKANQLSQMVRANLGAAMQGLVVIPIFAGFDQVTETGRIFEYDVTGGRYEERDHTTNGSGSMHATTVLKLGFKEAMTRDDAVALAMKSLMVAAEADSATGGPDPTRSIFPVVASITANGYERLSDDDLRSHAEQIQGDLHGTKKPRGAKKS